MVGKKFELLFYKENLTGKRLVSQVFLVYFFVVFVRKLYPQMSDIDMALNSSSSSQPADHIEWLRASSQECEIVCFKGICCYLEKRFTVGKMQIAKYITKYLSSTIISLLVPYWNCTKWKIKLLFIVFINITKLPFGLLFKYLSDHGNKTDMLLTLYLSFCPKKAWSWYMYRLNWFLIIT